MASSEIHAIGSVSGNQPRIRRIVEKATQTFLKGVPVQIDAGGGVKEWDGTTVAFGIAGFSLEDAANLTTIGIAKTLTFGSVPNQASAVNIPRGAPLNDGRNGFEAAAPDSMFKGQVGPAQSVTAANVGVKYGLTKDSDNHWYVDTTKTTVGTNTVVTVVKLDPNDQSATVRGVYFTVDPSAVQLLS